MAPDLNALGTMLRDRRADVGMSRAELARRIGVSAAYVWLVESARPRSNGSPSRPTESLLRRWTAVIGMNPIVVADAMRFAGYGDGDDPNEGVRRTFIRVMHPPEPPGTPAPLLQLPTTAAGWARDSSVSDEIDRLLSDAGIAGRRDEVERQLRSYIGYLRFTLEVENRGPGT